MEFFQYATGRALKAGYGFSHQTEGMSFSGASFQRSRDLSRMQPGSTVFELHPVDAQHTALVMTRVCSFGANGASFCYTHALISREAADPATLLRLLGPESFLDMDGFLALEEQKNNRIAMELRQLPLPEAADQAAAFPEGEEAERTIRALTGYLWRMSFLRRQSGARLVPAVLVLPEDYSLRQMADFFSVRVLPLLPVSLRGEVSVVFGAEPRFFGEFPQNTVCFVMNHEAPDSMPRFDLTRGTMVSSDKYTDMVVRSLGGCLRQQAFPALFEQVAGQLAPAWRDHFELAYRLEHFELLYGQARRKMDLLTGSMCGIYQRVTELLAEDGTDARRVLPPLESDLLQYWLEARQSEKTPPALYEFMAEMALTTADSGLWQRYLSALGVPVALNEQTDIDVLLQTQKISENNLWPVLQLINPARFAEIMKSRLSHEKDGHTALQLMEHLKEVPFAEDSMRQSIHQSMTKYMGNFSNEELIKVLTCDRWNSQEKKALESGVFAELDAGTEQLNDKQAKKLMDWLSGLNPEHRNVRKDQLLSLLEKWNLNDQIWCLLNDLEFVYERDKHPTAVQTENEHLAKEFSYATAGANNVDALLKVEQTWEDKCGKTYKRSWESFGDEIRTVRTAAEQAAQHLIKRYDIADCMILARQTSSSWYGNVIRAKLSETLENSLGSFIDNGNNLANLEKLPDLFDQLRMQGNDPRLQAIRDTTNLPADEQQGIKVLNQLYSEIGEHPAANLCRYLQQRAEKISGNDEMMPVIRCLMKHMDDFGVGWQTFFRQKDWLPEKGESPWKDGGWMLNVLRYVCGKVKSLKLDDAYLQALRGYLTGNEKWDGFIQHMENDKEYQRFMNDKEAHAPLLNELLGLK